MATTAVTRETLNALRETIAGLEGESAANQTKRVQDSGFAPGHPTQDGEDQTSIPLGIEAFDGPLTGLPLSGLMEIRTDQTRDAGAATGFALGSSILYEEASGKPVLWIGHKMSLHEGGVPYGVGLKSFGLSPAHLFLVTARSLTEALWVAESAVSARIFSCVLLEVRGNPEGLGLSESRRLHLRARAHNTPFVLLRQAGEEEASSAILRLLLKPAPASLRRLPSGATLKGSLGNPVFHLTIEKSRQFLPAFPLPASLTMEWNAHERRFKTVSTNPSLSSQPFRTEPHSLTGAAALGNRPVGTAAVGSVVAFERAS